MAKKKRNKKYTGRDAAQGVVVKKFEVDGKFDRKEWYKENRVKILGWVMRLVLVLIVAGIAWLIYSFVT